jgi:hypothetical protein
MHELSGTRHIRHEGSSTAACKLAEGKQCSSLLICYASAYLHATAFSNLMQISISWGNVIDNWQYMVCVAKFRLQHC